MEHDRAGKRLFWGDREPETLSGDLSSLCAFIHEPRRLSFLAFGIENRDLAGWLWLEDVILGYRASVNVFMRRRYWGDAAHEAGILLCDFAREVYELPELWAFTPWLTAKRWGERIGFKCLGVLPQWAIVGGKRLDVWFGKKEL